MISIKECAPDWEKVKEKHLAFIVPWVEEKIDFYSRLLICIRFGRINRHTSNDFFDLLKNEFELTNAGKHSFFRSKAKLVLISNTIENKNAYVNLLNPNNLKKSLQEMFKHLNYLKDHIDEIINFEFTPPYSTGYRNLKLIYLKTCHIDFLYDEIFDYDGFTKISSTESWGSYQLLQDLGINVCPYCNRQFTSTVLHGSQEIIRPDLDHFLPKKNIENKLLQVSFFNLIPSCAVCNRNLKHDKNICYTEHLNPYETNPKHELMKFSYVPRLMPGATGNSNDFDIVIKSNHVSSYLNYKSDGNKKLFKLQEIYQMHKDLVQDLIKRKEIWDAQHIRLTKNTYTDLRMKPEDAYRQLFGTYFEEEHFAKRPLSKLTKDIAEKLELLK